MKGIKIIGYQSIEVRPVEDPIISTRYKMDQTLGHLLDWTKELDICLVVIWLTLKAKIDSPEVQAVETCRKYTKDKPGFGNEKTDCCRKSMEKRYFDQFIGNQFL